MLVANILILYSTTDGHTLEICQRLQQLNEQDNHQVALIALNENTSLDLTSYEKVVIGASIRYGKHQPAVYDFIKKNHSLLERKANAFFSVNVVARKPEKNQPDTNPYMKKFLRQISWQPKTLAVFGGKIDYQRYPFWDRQIIRFIMWITNGPTDPKTKIDYTDWKQVETFARTISKM